MKKSIQFSDSITLGIVLAFSGGLMDAYSYLCRDQVFANAQTGNMLLFGVHFAEGNYPEALRYASPVLSFAIGIALAEVSRTLLEDHKIFHWRQIAVLLEAITLLAVGFIPLSHNLLANSLTSFACGIQVESFRKIHGNPIATTMCIGNMRSATMHLCHFLFGHGSAQTEEESIALQQKKQTSLQKSLLYYGIICCFVLGAVFGNYMVKAFSISAIWCSSIFLAIAFLLMFRPKAFLLFQN